MLNLCPCQPHQAAVSTNFSEPLHCLRQTCTSNPPTQVRTSWPQSSRRASPKEVNDEPKKEKQRDRKKGPPRSPGGADACDADTVMLLWCCVTSLPIRALVHVHVSNTSSPWQCLYNRDACMQADGCAVTAPQSKCSHVLHYVDPVVMELIHKKP